MLLISPLLSDAADEADVVLVIFNLLLPTEISIGSAFPSRFLICECIDISPFVSGFDSVLKPVPKCSPCTLTAFCSNGKFLLALGFRAVRVCSSGKAVVSRSLDIDCNPAANWLSSVKFEAKSNHDQESGSKSPAVFASDGFDQHA